MKDFKKKIVLVTGSSRGIGKAIALELARRGAVIVVHASGKSKHATKSLRDVQKISPNSFLVIARVEKYHECKEIARTIEKKVGRVDVLVNNAGILRDRTLAKMTQKEWREVIGVNLTGVFNTTSCVMRMIPDGGRVINISSFVGIRGGFGQTNYAAAKAGVIGFTKSLALELARKKITVNAVAPGFIDTDILSSIPEQVMKEKILPAIPHSRLGKPEEVAKIVAFLASCEADYVTGQVVGVTGGIIL
ncbi:3-oxoacyl-ACP reductase FabG [Pseudomonadota bacterium]